MRFVTGVGALGAVACLLLPAATTDARYRMYSAAEIWRLELVRTLRAFGFGLAARHFRA